MVLHVTSNYVDGVVYGSRENAMAVPELIIYYTSPGGEEKAARVKP